MSAARNDVTGDKIRSKVNNQAFRDNWELAFGKKKELGEQQGTAGHPDRRRAEDL